MYKLKSRLVNKYTITFILAIINALLIWFIPAYLYGFVFVLMLAFLITIIIIVIDIIEKTRLWPFAVYLLLLAVLSVAVVLFFY
jgi:hypothetical protein